MKTSRQVILKYKQDEVLYEMKIFLRFLENRAITHFVFCFNTLQFI